MQAVVKPYVNLSGSVYDCSQNFILTHEDCERRSSARYGFASCEGGGRNGLGGTGA